MKTLLQINIVVNWGSTGRIAEEIGLTAIKNGWISYIAYGRNSSSSKSKTIKIGSECDVKLHGIKSRLFDQHGFGSKEATIKFIEKIKEIKPDIIHLHNIHGYYINIEILFNYLANANIPIVWTMHDCWAFTGHCAYFDYVECDKWKKQCFSCPQINTYPKSFFLDRSKRNFNIKHMLFNSVKKLTIVPVSNWLENLLNQSFLKNYPLQRIYNGTNLYDFSPQNYEISRTNYGIGKCFVILGIASNWSKRKGLADFLALNKLINNDFIIVLVGLNEKQIKNLPKNMIGINRTENINQLAEIYSASDLFLNLTYEDNFPTTNIESLACGTPVLTYNTGGSVEAVNSETGFVVEKGDLQAIINVINTVKEKGKEFYSKACRERAEILYNKDDRYNEYINLYNKTLRL